jgi:UDP-N-acetylmuramoyl-L-alanyl-D-glutamate--2,6-diaminopimelate ligase
MWQKIKNYFHLVQAVIANVIYGFPSRKLTVIGVTGTDGKTTTTSLIYHILNESGKKAAMITSVGAYIGDKVYDIGFHVTTPSPFGLQKYIKKAVDLGMEYLVLETTSHALDQNRVWGIEYKIGVLTNITHEHLDYHKTYEEYAKIKINFVVGCHLSVVNMDDESYKYLKKFSIFNSQFSNNSQNPIPKFNLSNYRLITYSLMDKNAEYTMKKFPFSTELLGEFNKYNCLAAIAVGKSLGLKDDEIRKAILSFQAPPGRQEMVYDKDFLVMIDFAHTPNAFTQILPEVKKITKGRLIHVFGSAGKRDFTKRPEMGRAAARWADIIVLTAEDPRSELIADINSQIKQGIDSRFKIYSSNDVRSVTYSSRTSFSNRKILFEIPDRKEAIEFAISLAKKGDTVLLTGKSHEKSMNLGQGEEPWDEFEVVKSYLDRIKASK